MQAVTSHDDAFAEFDPTPLQPVRPGAWVETDEELFERERSAMEADIEAARARAERSRIRLTTRRAAAATATEGEQTLQRALDQLEQDHRGGLQRLELDTDRAVSSILDEARQDADRIIREAMADGVQS